MPFSGVIAPLILLVKIDFSASKLINSKIGLVKVLNHE
jgi:hypothetical protein